MFKPFLLSCELFIARFYLNIFENLIFNYLKVIWFLDASRCFSHYFCDLVYHREPRPHVITIVIVLDPTWTGIISRQLSTKYRGYYRYLTITSQQLSTQASYGFGLNPPAPVMLKFNILPTTVKFMGCLLSVSVTQKFSAFIVYWGQKE